MKKTIQCLSILLCTLCIWGCGNPTSETQVNSSTENAEPSTIEEAYQDVHDRLGEEKAKQLLVFAKHYETWLPDEGECAGGSLGIAVYDLDQDGKLELMCTLIQGTGIYDNNAFYQADTEQEQVLELGQTPDPMELAFEIENPLPAEEWTSAYLDEEGRILYISADYGRAGMRMAACTEGYYYLEQGEVISEPIRSYVWELMENDEEIYTYYLPEGDSAVEKEVWENAKQEFLVGKEERNVTICWKDLYEEDMEGMQELEWFLLLTESLEGGK